jgi:3-oxoacyl-[acyl-carrier-protein] synthase II
MFVLESAELAKRRGARVYGEIAGFGASSDAFHLVLPSNDSDPMCNAMRAAMADAQVESHEIDYVNAHAPGTPAGDRAESRALRQVLGDATASTPVSSTKSVTGHLLSAAAAMEALASLVAIACQAIPPTINLDHPDPECELNHVPHHARDAAVNVVLSNSFGFGGNNTSLILRKAA